MTFYLRSTPSLYKNRKKNVTRFEKLDRKTFQSGNKIPSYKTPRPDPTRDIPSSTMENVKQDATARNSIMERALRGEESDAVRDEIIRKSKCLAPAYNKGAVQYIGNSDQAKDLGK